jgi:hypothetical protein
VRIPSRGRHYVVAEIQLVEETVEVPAVLYESVGIDADVVELVGGAIPDEIGRDAATSVSDPRNNSSPEVGGRGVAVQEDDGPAAFASFVVRLPLAV